MATSGDDDTMAAVIRLVTVVDIDDRPAPLTASALEAPAPEGFEPGLAPPGPATNGEDPGSMSLSAMHLAVLQDGHRLTLLDDRGWSASGPPDIWHRTTVAEIEATARMVVGPDEPFASRSVADMEADHWAALAGILGQQGVLVTSGALSRLPHDVELTERLRARLTDT